MWIRQVTGTSGRRANFVATLTYQESNKLVANETRNPGTNPLHHFVAPCGAAGTLDATSSPQLLSSPNYPAAPGSNLRCRWLVDGNTTAVQLRFQQLDIGADGVQQCTNDRLEIQDIIQTGQGAEANEQLVLNGDGANIVRLDNRRVMIQREIGQRLTFCGTRLPHDVISSGRSMAVTLITGPNAGSSRGFQLQYSLACNFSRSFLSKGQI